MNHALQPWQEYLHAARRKVAICSYHRDRLIKVLKRGNDESEPSIPVQAHFEGVVVCAMAAVDQVAQAVNSAVSLGLGPGRLFQGAFDWIVDRVPHVQEWRDDLLGRDLRRTRTRMVHYSYAKRPGRLVWVVEGADSGYSGSRELSEYSASAVRYVEKLVAFLPEIEKQLKMHTRED